MKDITSLIEREAPPQEPSPVEPRTFDSDPKQPPTEPWSFATDPKEPPCEPRMVKLSSENQFLAPW